MPRQEALQRFLDGLLSVKRDVVQEGGVAVNSWIAARRSLAALTSQDLASSILAASGDIEQFALPNDRRWK